MKVLRVLVIAGLAGVMALGSAVIAAESMVKAPEQGITIQGKKPVVFKHDLHLSMGLECGVCHHNSAHQPMDKTAMSAIPSVEDLQCAKCHNDGFANPKLQKRKDVFHARCQTCHKEGVNGKNGPTKCAGCHGEKKKAIEGC